MKAFEIFLQRNKVTPSDWQEFEGKLFDHENKFSIELNIKSNCLEFYLYAKNDLSVLNASLNGFILKPVKRTLSLKESGKNNIKLRLKSNRNLLETIEREGIKKQRSLDKIVIHFRKIYKTRIYQTKMFLEDSDHEELYSSHLSLKNPLLSFELNFNNNVGIKKKSIPLYLKIDEASELFTIEKKYGFLEVFSFPNFSKTMFFPLDKFEFGKHSLIVGQSGTGKSKFIELFIKNIPQKTLQNDYVVVIIDPHAALSSHFKNMNCNTRNFDFTESSCELFPSFSEPKIATELSILLFKTLMKDQFNAKMERVLKYSIYTLFLKNQMSLKNLKNFLTQLEFRKSLVNELGANYDYLSHFFESEFVEMQTKFYETAIMPVLVLIDELSFLPSFSTNNSLSLEESLKENSLITFNLNRIFLGERAIKLIAGLIIQQLFLIAQKSAVKKKIILIIDEVSIVENESLSSILAEARKFNLSLFLSQQYLTQIKPELLKGILSNVYNYFIFKMSDEDAKILSQNLDISFPDEVLIQQKKNGSSEDDLKRNLLVTLNPRECLVRVFARGKFFPCFKAKTIYIK